VSSYIDRNSPRRAAATLLALLVGTLSGCGEDAVAVDQYANDLCTALVGWTEELRDRQTELQEGSTPDRSPEDDRAALERFVEGAVAASDRFVEAVEAAGEPDIENGEEAAAAFRAGAEETRDELEEARGEVAELPTDSPATYRAALRTTLEADEQFRDVDAPELDRALDEASACQG
jgi:4-hydroxy-L-threonine phosphate dehydrogenase PdxA